MAIRDIARTSVATVDPDTDIATVVRKLHQDAVGGLVVTVGEEPLGFVTDRTLTIALLEDDIDPGETPVREYVDEDTPMVSPDDGIYETLDQLSNHGVRRAIVVEDGSIAGIVSLSDVIVHLEMELQMVANVIRASSPAYEQEGPGFRSD